MNIEAAMERAVQQDTAVSVGCTASPPRSSIGSTSDLPLDDWTCRLSRHVGNCHECAWPEAGFQKLKGVVTGDSDPGNSVLEGTGNCFECCGRRFMGRVAGAKLTWAAWSVAKP
jgi:hypothetical protein